MSKLPAEFVKPPAGQAKQPRTRRARKTSLISPEPVADPRELMLHLTDEEYRALEEARQQLLRTGTEITLEQMIHRVFADWMLRSRAVVQTPPASEPTATPRDEHMLARLRAFVAEPLRSWRELAVQKWRASHLRRSWQRTSAPSAS
jgi:hypothetical protein